MAQEKLYKEYDRHDIFKRLNEGFDHREQWRNTQVGRLQLPQRLDLPSLSLGAPAMDYVKETVFLAKKDNPTYSPKEIYYDILKQSVPLYKFKDVYNNDEISSRFDADELEKLKQKYLRDGVPHHEFVEYMDELIKTIKEKHRQSLRRESRLLAASEANENKSSCVTMGGRIKNTFQKKNKSNKNKSKRVNKRIKKNKRYSRKYSRKSLKK
jgi:hypothetical protein